MIATSKLALELCIITVSTIPIKTNKNTPAIPLICPYCAISTMSFSSLNPLLTSEIPRKKNPIPQRIEPKALAFLEFWRFKITPKTSRGIVTEEISNFTPAMAITHATIVVPRFAPKIMPMPCPNVIKPAARKEIARTETSPLLCIIIVEIAPKIRLFVAVFAHFFSTRSMNVLKFPKPFLRHIIPYKKIAIPDAASKKELDS